MSRGKKFDAAEKHFQAKAIVYQREAREMRQAIMRLTDENKRLKRALVGYGELKVKYDKLKELSELSESDLKAVLNQARAVSQFNSLLSFGRGTFQ